MKLEVGMKVTVKKPQRPYYYGYGARKHDLTMITPGMKGTVKAINCPAVNRRNVMFHCADFEIGENTYRLGLSEDSFKIIDADENKKVSIIFKKSLEK